MDSLKKIFKKQGGIQLLKQCFRNGSLPTAIGEFLMLGESRTALEILRLSTQLKANQKLSKKYRPFLKKFDSEFVDKGEHKVSDKVWVCWFQGIEIAPLIVQKCYESLKRNMPTRNIILITSENMSKYVKFPDYILEKWEKGQITNTHMTDLLRLELLIQYGGMWADATVFCSDSNIPNYFFDSDLFMFQFLKPGRDGYSHLTSSWLVSAKSNNKVLKAVLYLCYQYWKDHNSLIDYFLFHDFMAIVLEYYQEDWEAIVPRDNSTPHILQLKLFDKYDKDIWDAIKSQTQFHKLTYKFDNDKTRLEGTFYKELIENNT